ncbi:hypothetical protein [Emticicia fontis]
MFKRAIDYNYQHIDLGVAKVTETKMRPEKVVATVTTFLNEDSDILEKGRVTAKHVG